MFNIYNFRLSLMQRARLETHKSTNLNQKIPTSFWESRYSQQKNKPPFSTSVKFRLTHKTYQGKNIKKIKSEAQSPEHGQPLVSQVSTDRQRVNIKTQSLFSERNSRKNTIHAIIQRKYHAGIKAPLSNTPQKFIIKTSGLILPRQDPQKLQTPTKFSRVASLQKRKGTQSVQKNASSVLYTDFELEEMKKFPVLFTGVRRIKTKSEFTDGEGNVLAKKGDAVAYRYEIMEMLGKGAFGKVFKAFDHKKQQMVALKIIKSIPKLNEQAKIQVNILQKSLQFDQQSKCNIVKMKSSFVFRAHTCITYEILSKNLYEYLKETNFRPTSQKIMVKFAIQILHSLNFLKQNNIVHCDIKPENIMLKDHNKTGIRIIDLGSSCYEPEQFYTYIQSRFYRAPEIILGIRYSCAIDMWSFGLVLVELLTGYPLFPGQNQEEQLVMYMEILGYPPTFMIQTGSRRKRFFNEKFECRIIQSKQNYRIPNSVSLEKAIGQSPDRNLIDLIKRCLEWNPVKRITPKEALLHEWVLDGIPQNIRARHIAEVTGKEP